MQLKTLRIVPFCFLMGLVVVSCKQQEDIKDQMQAKHTVCYRAIDGADTAWLKIDTAANHMIGFFEFNYANQKRYAGQVKGTLKGDTLKGHYDFKVNKVDKWYRNPVAFLKRDGKLIMGVGNFNMVWGSAFFDEKVPIDFDKGKFVFERVGCR